MTARPMTLCFVSQEYPPETGGGGIGTQTWLRARGLSARGHTVHVVAASWDDQHRTLRDEGAIIYRIAEPRLRVPGFEPSSYWLAYSEAVAAKLTELQETVTFDVIQFAEYGGEGFIFQTDTFANRRAKYVVQMHGPLAMFAEHWAWPEPGTPLHQIGCFMEKTSLQYADRLLASSRHTAAYCQKVYGVDTGNAGVVYSGVDVDRFAPRDGPHGARQPRILFVGGLSGGKGATDVIRAVARLKQHFPELILRMIGKGTPEQLRAIEKLVTEHHLKDNFELVGYARHDQLPNQYAWCQIFAAPSVYEGGPGNVYLEAMASGRPVIACNTGGIPEVVEHNETGILIPPRNIDALVEAIGDLATNLWLREELGRRARMHVVGNFSVETYLDNCEAYYRQLL